MTFYFENLDAETRKWMLAELDEDLAQNRLHISPYLSGQGVHDYPKLLREALERGNEDSLAEALRQQRRIERSADRKKPSGGYAIVTVPENAAQVLAESEFNRYYIRGVARRAVEAGIPEVVVYRA